MGNPYAPPGESQRPPQQPAAAPGGRGAAPDGPHPRGSSPVGPQGWPPPGTPPPGRDQHTPPQHTPPHHPQPHHAGSPVPPERPAPDPAVARATARRVMHFLAFLLAAVLTSALPVPWQAAALAFVGAAIVVGIRAVVLAWLGGVRGGLVVMLTVGVVMAGFVGLGMLSLLALWPEQLERQECLARAVTISATQRCEVEFQRSLEERLGGFGSRGS